MNNLYSKRHREGEILIKSPIALPLQRTQTATPCLAEWMFRRGRSGISVNRGHVLLCKCVKRQPTYLKDSVDVSTLPCHAALPNNTVMPA